MKTLKITFATACLFLTTLMVQAKNSESSLDKSSMDYAVVTYVNAFSYGNSQDLSDVLFQDVKMTIQSSNKIKSYTKANILQFAHNQEGVKQNCKTSYSVIEKTPSQVIVKVNMAYDTFTKVNYVTMLQTDKGWKITNISSVFN